MNLNKTQILYRLIQLLAFMIPLSQFLSVRLLFFICIYSLFVNEMSGSFRRFLKNSWDAILYLLILLLGLLYSDDLNLGLRTMETSFSLLAFPIIFSKIAPLQQNQLNTVLKSFVVGLLIACTICLWSSALLFYQNGEISTFFYYQFAQKIELQPTYLAYYLCFAITIGLYFLYYEMAKVPSWFLVLIVLYLFAILMLTAGRTAYISILLTFSFFILKYLYEERAGTIKTITFLISILLLIGILIVNHFDLNTSYINAEENNDFWERLVLWKAALQANPNFLFGVGTGDYKLVLNQYFISHDLQRFAMSSYNSHNQFIQILFSNGLIGLISLVFLIGRPIYLSLKHQNILGILIFFPFLIYGVTEVFLGRYQGVVFFSFLHQCLISHYSINASDSKGRI
jgi:O-antigen ligase